jgi:hypothetical protein
VAASGTSSGSALTALGEDPNGPLSAFDITPLVRRARFDPAIGNNALDGFYGVHKRSYIGGIGKV